MKKRDQIFVIHGGMTFKHKKDYLHFLKTRSVSIEPKIRWSDTYFSNQLGKDFEIIKPRMPLPENAKYAEWKIHFERHFSQLRDNIILVGISLGGIFLAKYLSENKFPKRIRATYLIAPPFDAGDFRGLADSLKELLSSQELAQTLAKNAFEKVKLYDSNIIGERINSFLVSSIL